MSTQEPLWGWLVVASVHIAFLLWGGVIKSVGVLLPALSDMYACDVWILGWIIAAMCSANNIAGPGFGAFGCICKITLGIYFNERLTLATSIALMGQPESLIVFSMFAQFLLETFGPRGNLLILGALTMHLVPCAMLLRPRQVSGHRQYPRRCYSAIDSTTSMKDSPVSQEPVALIGRLLDVNLLTKLDTWVLILSFTLFSFVNDAWMTFMVSNAISKGFDGYVATSFSLIAGCSAIVTSFLQGVMLSKGVVSNRLLSAVAAGMGSIALLINPVHKAFWSMSISVVLYGITLAVLMTTILCLAIEILGRDRIAGALGWMGLVSGSFRILLGFCTGLLYDVTGDYNATFVLLGSMIGLIIPILYSDTLVSMCRERIRPYKEKTALYLKPNWAPVPAQKQVVRVQPRNK
ncbi:monocarboxylate transporter 11-like isoform X2 [Patiria miniata]|uniref:Monocarboxylate transporter n=1 Tax=Patiria miniata TaxID=46514 RepID=A0A913Z2I8_PATMI|nr:monocarboxylate transporter 11-like isoform X2 [Patiria miniata]